MFFQRTGFGSRFNRILLSAYFPSFLFGTQLVEVSMCFHLCGALIFWQITQKKLTVHTDKTLASEPSVANY